MDLDELYEEYDRVAEIACYVYGESEASQERILDDLEKRIVALGGKP